MCLTLLTDSHPLYTRVVCYLACFVASAPAMCLCVSVLPVAYVVCLVTCLLSTWVCRLNRSARCWLIAWGEQSYVRMLLMQPRHTGWLVGRSVPLCAAAMPISRGVGESLSRWSESPEIRHSFVHSFIELHCAGLLHTILRYCIVFELHKLTYKQGKLNVWRTNLTIILKYI